LATRRAERHAKKSKARTNCRYPTGAKQQTCYPALTASDPSQELLLLLLLLSLTLSLSLLLLLPAWGLPSSGCCCCCSQVRLGILATS